MNPTHDVIFALRGTWISAVHREYSYPEDRLALALPSLARIRRVLVCEPYRGASRSVLRTLAKPSVAPFQTDGAASLYGPLRVRREDPVEVADIARLYATYERRIRRVAHRRGLSRPAIISANPLLAGYGGFDWAGPVTYYGWDDWAASEPHRRWWPAYEAAFELIRHKRRHVVAVSQTILDRIQPAGRGIVVPNGIVPAEWEVLSDPPDWFASRPSPRLLYVGSLESRIDVEQLRGLAEDLPDASITLVGSMVDPGHFLSLADVPNIEIRQRVSRDQLPGLVAHADVALIPHVRSSLTEAMSPLKLYEYLAAGVPVASVDLPGTRGISNRVFLAAPGSSLTDAVRQALARGRMSSQERLDFLAAHSWEARFHNLLDSALGPDGSQSESQSERSEILQEVP
jgi:glycosyltransferase involved in cell wall biosynthesis